MRGGKFLDLTGQRFGRLRALFRLPQQEKGKASKWHCICDCGKELDVFTSSLRSGNTKSCGCYKIDRIREVHIKHGHSKKGGGWDRIANVLKSMITRCENPKNKYYRYYGGKGISVCDEWHDINTFCLWATQSGYRPGLTIDRIDNSKGYCPENCRWVTRAEQNKNMTRHHIILGKPLYQWLDIFTTSPKEREKMRSRIYRRLAKGWCDYLAIFAPIPPIRVRG